jgi:hypothetical protein
VKRYLGLGLVLAGVIALLAPGAALAAKPKAAGPSFDVLGFGINQLFVAKGTTVKSEELCDAIVGGEGSPVGPPQQVYLTVYVRATGIPKKAKVEFKDSLPYGYDEVASPTLSEPVPFSQIYGVGGIVGTPENTKNLYYEPIVSFSAEAGQYEGPSAEEFNGEYAYSAQTKVGGQTLKSTAKVTVDCPQLR